MYCRYYTEQSDSEMDMWTVISRTRNKFLTLVVTPFKVIPNYQSILDCSYSENVQNYGEQGLKVL